MRQLDNFRPCLTITDSVAGYELPAELHARADVQRHHPRQRPLDRFLDGLAARVAGKHRWHQTNTDRCTLPDYWT